MGDSHIARPTTGFPTVDVSPDVELWLKSAYMRFKAHKKVEPAEMLVELWGQIPEDFDYRSIDKRLIRFGVELTLLGILQIDPSTTLATETDHVLNFIRESIIKNPAIESVTAQQISESTGVREVQVSLVLTLVRDLGNFWNGASGHSDVPGYTSIIVKDEFVKREYLKYKGLAPLLDRFFAREDQKDSTNQHASSGGLSAKFSDTERKRANLDVCLSFAGEDRPYVEQVASFLKKAGVSVFYDGYEEVELWGKDLYQHLGEVYRDKAQYCVIFISAAYSRKLWTKHELQNAQARAFEENREYILPVRFDNTELPGVLRTTKYIDLRTKSPDELAKLIIRKVRKDPLGDIPVSVDTQGVEDEVPWKNLKQLASIRKRLSEPLNACEHYRQIVQTLVQNGKWSHTVPMTYPAEMRQGENQFDSRIRSFTRELQSAANEVKEILERRRKLTPAWFVAVAPNELELVSKALITAACDVAALTNLRKSIRGGASGNELRASAEYTQAVTSLNGIEDAIDTVNEREVKNRAFADRIFRREG